MKRTNPIRNVMTMALAAMGMLAAIHSAAQIGAKAQQSGLTGIWQNNQFGYQMTLMLNKDGSGEFDGDMIRYSAQGTQLTIVQNGTTTLYQFALSGQELTLSGGDIDGKIIFTRSDGSTTTSEARTDAQQPVANQAKNLVGTWQGYGETIAFDANGTCRYLGQSYPYQASSDQVTLMTQQGGLQMNYRIDGDRLQLTVNGKTLEYQKGTARTETAATTGGRVAQELVGKWCYVNVTSTNTGGSSTDECITLNADGSYEYYSERSMSVNTNAFAGGTASQNADRGTWRVDGNRIYYDSPTRGQGSYQLQLQNHPRNGDPMIILDGTTYVTYFQKSPWR